MWARKIIADSSTRMLLLLLLVYILNLDMYVYIVYWVVYIVHLSPIYRVVQKIPVFFQAL